MPDPNNPPSSAGDPLDAIIAAYVQQVEAGDVPNREDMLAQHPDLADRLRAFFADFDRLDRQAAELRLSADLNRTTDAPGPEGELPRVRYFGDYELLEVIARGGMGVVYKARQVSLNRVVALKMVLRGELATERDVARFRSEAESAANLDHPNIVPIYEVGEHDGQQYYSMRYVEGASLARQPRSNARSEAQLVATIAGAIHHAHRRGVLHRDIKPSNILVDAAGVPLVADFGLAKRVDANVSLTETGAIVGTPRYMAPEQAAGRKDLTVAVDVYSLGVVLYERLTGRTPFAGENVLELLRQAREEEPPRPSSVCPGLDRDLETICLKCLEKDSAKRYASAEALQDDLARWLRGEPIAARPVGTLGRLTRWCRRKPGIAASLAGLFATLFVGVIAASILATTALRYAEQADREAALARDNEKQARENAEQTRKEKELSDHRYYAAEMKLASLDWEAGQTLLMLLRLGRFEPKPGGENRRGFELDYLQRQAQLDFRSFNANGGVRGMAFSSDGRRLASASDDKTVRVWDAATGQETLALHGHTDGVYGVAFSPDGCRLASASHDQTVKVWDVTSGREILTLRGHTGWVHAVAFSPDGRRLASASWDQTVNIWDAVTGQQALTLRGHTSYVTGVVFSPGGRRIASAGWDGTIRLWDTITGRPTLTINSHRSLPGMVRSFGVAFSPDGRRIAAGSDDRTLKVWDAVTGHEVLTLRGHTDSAYAVAFSPDGRRLASGSEDKTAKVWDAVTGQEILALRGHGSWVQGVAFSADGWRLATVDFGGIKLWDTVAAQVPLTLPGHGRGAFSPDGRRLAAPGEFQTVKVWDVSAGDEILTLHGHAASVTVVAFSPDGQLLASAGRDGTAKIWNAGTGRELLTLRGHTDAVRGVAFSPDGRRVASASVDGTVKVWDAATGLQTLTLRVEQGGPMESVEEVAFSPDGRRLTSASFFGAIKVWDVATGENITFPGKDSVGGLSLAFSGDGRRAVSGGIQSLMVWDVATGQKIVDLHGHIGGVYAVAFSPDGRRIVSGGQDGAVKLWDAVTGQEIFTLHGHTASVIGVAFSTDGRHIASASNDGTVKIWDATPLTEELRIQREATSLVRFLFERPADPILAAGTIGVFGSPTGHGPLLAASALLPERIRLLARDQAVATIRRDRTISEPLRKAALAWTDRYEESLIAAEAEKRIAALFGQPLLRSQVLEHIRNDQTLPQSVRWKALTLAQTWPENLQALNDASWLIVHHPGAPVQRYQQALRYAETACRLEPENGYYLNTLGVAQYRAGRYQDALATLTRSDEINSKAQKGSRPFDLAFLAMTQYRLGKRKEAQSTFARLNQALKDPAVAGNQDNAGFRREVESLLQEKKSP